MILTVTLNTSIDKAYFVERFDTGTTMRVKNAQYTAGGKGLNVARVINALDEEVMATGFIGGFAGSFIENQLAGMKIPYKFTRIDGESRSCINIIDETTQVHTELLEPGPEIGPGDVETFLKLYKELIQNSRIIVISGSAPIGITQDIYKTLVSMAKEYSKMVILDSSCRLLAEGIEASPYMIKPNLREVEQLYGRKIHDIKEIVTAAKEFLSRGVNVAAISMGEKGVIAADSGTGKVYMAKPPKIRPANTVGCGDAMVAGFAVAFNRGYDMESCVKLGVAASVASALSLETGGCDLVALKNVFENVVINIQGLEDTSWI